MSSNELFTDVNSTRTTSGSTIDWNELGLDIGFLLLSTAVCIFSIVSQFRGLQPKQKTLKYLLGNTFVWINTLYVIAVVATILRMVLRLSLPGQIRSEITAIVYNWAASLICAINAIMPIKFIRMTFNPFGIKLTGEEDLPIMIAVTGWWVVILLATIIVAVTVGESSLIPALSAWRYYFTAVAFVELFALSWFIVYCITGLKKDISTMKVQGNNLLLFCVTTFIMRIGIVGSNFCKMYGVAGVTQESLKIIHMSLVCVCLTAFNFPKFMRWGEDATKSKAGSTVGTSGKQSSASAANKSVKAISVVQSPSNSTAAASPSIADNTRQRTASQRREKSTSMGV
jgi:hypothetical protein